MEEWTIKAVVAVVYFTGAITTVGAAAAFNDTVGRKALAAALLWPVTWAIVLPAAAVGFFVTGASVVGEWLAAKCSLNKNVE